MFGKPSVQLQEHRCGLFNVIVSRSTMRHKDHQLSQCRRRGRTISFGDSRWNQRCSNSDRFSVLGMLASWKIRYVRGPAFDLKLSPSGRSPEVRHNFAHFYFHMSLALPWSCFICLVCSSLSVLVYSMLIGSYKLSVVLRLIILL